ncbi:galactonate transporter [Klebsiella pneumoniae]|uniref:Galactonate transporter n=1 Tax=Klebsiella pneumoniae TaxID=573 RepID=A0A2X3CXF9_KLEPN|nr:galactonate transporter [Klebsiella pneumoniae]
MILDSTLDEKKGIPTRYLILLMIFVGDGSELWRPRDLVYRRY